MGSGDSFRNIGCLGGSRSYMLTMGPGRKIYRTKRWASGPMMGDVAKVVDTLMQPAGSRVGDNQRLQDA